MGKGNWRQQPGLLGQIKACTIASLIVFQTVIPWWWNTSMLLFSQLIIQNIIVIRWSCQAIEKVKTKSLLTVLLFYFFVYVPLFLAFAAVNAVSFYYQWTFLCTTVSVNPEIFITPMAWRAQAFGKVCFLRSSPLLEWGGGSGFPGGWDSKEYACNAGDTGSILGWEDPLEKGMATHSSILAWRIPWTEEPDSMDMSLTKIRKMAKDGKAWHTAVHGVTQSWTWLNYCTTTPLLSCLC